MNDTRRDKRAPVSLKVRFKSATVDEFRDQYSIDISRGGLFIKSKSPMAVGTLLKFEFQLKDKSRLIHGVGRVVWARPASAATEDAPAGMGIKFIKMDPDSRALVLDIVEGRGAGAGRFDEGVTEDPAAAAPMFPDLPPAEQPALEDRTAVRHANEFLASALAQGEAGSSAEAEQLAEEARRRTAARDASAIALSAGLADAVKATAQPVVTSQGEASREGPDTSVPAEPPSVELSMSGLGADELGDYPPREDEEADEVAKEAVPYDDVVSGELPTEPLDVPAPAVPVAAAPASAPTAAPSPDTASETAPPASGSRAWMYVFVLLLVGGGAFVGMRHFGILPGGPLFGAEPTQDVAAVAEPTPAVEPPAVEEAPPEPPVAEEPAAEAVMVDVNVTSTPRGAEVRLGDELLGATPATVQLPLGEEATLEISAEGHRTAQLPVTATEGTPTVEATLEPLPFVVHVETSPPGATARLGRESITTPGDLTLPAGSGNVTVRVSLAGYRAESRGLSRAGFIQGAEAMERTLEITLREQAAPRPPAPTSPEPSTDEAAPTESAPAPTPAEPAPSPAPTPSEPAPAP